MGEGIKIEFPEGTLEQQISKGLQATILAGAAQHIMKNITPEHIHQFALDILQRGLKDVSEWEMRKAIAEQAAPLIKDYTRRPDFIARLEEAVKEGLEKFLKELPDVIYEEVKDIVVTAMVDRYKRIR